MEQLHDWDNWTEWEPTDNDHEPSPGSEHPADHGFFWSMWVEPYEGVINCAHAPAPREPYRRHVEPVGLARIPLHFDAINDDEDKGA